MEKCILIVDDNPVIRDVIKSRLSKVLNLSHSREAANGPEAIELALKSKPDLVILDISMPETPIILFTIYKLDDDAAKLGVDAVVSKLNLRKLTEEVSARLMW